MEVTFKIIYHSQVVKEDIPKLSSFDKEQIKSTILDRLTTHPEIFGKPLRQSLKGYRNLRVGDDRIIFRIEHASVKIFMIEHRSVVYWILGKRL